MITWILIILIIVFITIKLIKRPKNFPPGPRGFPLVGYAPLFYRQEKLTHKAAVRLSETYGPVVGLYFGQTPVVFVTGHRAVKECLTNDTFNGRPGGIVRRHTLGTGKLGLVFTDGDFWQEQRRFALWHLRDFGFGKIDLESTIHEEISDLLEEVQAESESGNVLNVNNLFGISIINTLWVVMAGERFKHNDTNLKKLLKVVNDIFRSGTATGGAFNLFPFLKYIAPKLSGFEEAQRRQRAIQEFIQKHVEQHKETFDENSMRDFMDVYLKELKKTEQTLHSSFSENQLIALCNDMFTAGAETTSNFLVFGILYMILYPDVQKKVQRELDEVVGKGRLPSLNDRPNLLYTEATLMEIFRMSNITPLTVPHRAMDNADLLGYTIPKDTMVMVNLWSIHMDKDHWGDPEVFRPERFLKEGKLVRDDWLVPFGIGKRACAGEALARRTTYLFFAAFMQKFSCSVPPGENLPDTEPSGGLTITAKPFTARIVIRV